MLTLNSILELFRWSYVSRKRSMTFLTANDPSVFDNAMMRSCRVDYKICLDYLDMYQFKNMFESFFPDQKRITKNVKNL